MEMLLFLFTIFQTFLFSINRLLKSASECIIFKRSESGISQVSFAEHPLKITFLQ